GYQLNSVHRFCASSAGAVYESPPLCSAGNKSESAQTQSAVHDQGLAGDEVAAGDQTENRAGDFVRRGNALERIARRRLGDHLAVILPVVLAHPRRVGERRRHAVHPHVRRHGDGESTPEIDETLTIMPRLASSSFAAARAQRNAPFTLTSRISSQISSVSASRSEALTQWVTPALLT